MYLSKLELQGFKSFAERTVLHFDPGITAIVGPNGCGKSNVVDAVRWVVGEQRARILRSEKMENVIFTGTSSRRPLGMSEVLLTIENNRGVLPTQYDEVQLGRRLYRSGDSEYLMNGVVCRLKDVTNLFMDTGMGAGAYSVIELRMIDEILSEHAEDRRRLFEEAAGITKYKVRRRQTLGKLDATRSDLSRIRDLTDEVARQVRSLQRQARQAERYSETSARLRELEVALAYVEFTCLTGRRDALEEERIALKEQSDQAADRLVEQEERLTGLRKELVEGEERVDACRADLARHLEEVHDLETEKCLAEERLASARSEWQRIREEQATTETRGFEVEGELEQLEASLEEAGPRLQEAEKRLEAAQEERDACLASAQEEREAFEAAQERMRTHGERRSAQQRALDRLVERRDLIGQDLERMQAKVWEIDGLLDGLCVEEAESEEAKSRAAATVEAMRSALEKAERERSARQAALDAALDSMRRLERSGDALSAEVRLLESVLASYEEFTGAVQYLATSDWLDDGVTTVSDLLACDARDRIALDAALGAFGGCIVVHSGEEAARAVERLRRDERGLASFVLLDRISSASSATQDAPPGNGRALERTPPSASDGRVPEATPLSALVRTVDPTYDALAGLLLHDAYLVDTLDQAEVLAAHSPSGVRFFARTGEWVDPRGVMQGGSREKSVSPVAGRLERRERLGEVNRALEEVDRNLERAKADVAEHVRMLESVAFEGRREMLAAAERHLNEAEKRVELAAFRLESTRSQRSELSSRIDQAERSLEHANEESECLEEALRTTTTTLAGLHARLVEARASFDGAEMESRRAALTFNEANIEAVKARNRFDRCRREVGHAHEHLREMRVRTEQRELRIQELEETIGQTEKRRAQAAEAWARVRDGREALEDARAQAEQGVRAVRKGIDETYATLRALRTRREHLTAEEHRRDLDFTETRTRMEDLVDHLGEEFGVSLPEAMAGDAFRLPDDFDEGAARSEVDDLRRARDSMGPVNELALETWEGERERLGFLMQQQEDLEQAEETLLRTIDEINATASKQFMVTFEEIRRNFQETFEHLFGEGAGADLVLEHRSDPLETAIGIKARPSGKSSSTISLLSGGEKALTAIALLFGIYLVKPSPFCILDEVDAPLDDHNVERFMRLIRQFAANTQFILVTHNKRTMEASDRLYGVTMQEPGVSRLVCVKFDEAAEMVERSSREAA